MSPRGRVYGLCTVDRGRAYRPLTSAVAGRAVSATQGGVAPETAERPPASFAAGRRHGACPQERFCGGCSACPRHHLGGPIRSHVFTVLVSNMPRWWGLNLWAWPSIQVFTVQLDVEGAGPIDVERDPSSLSKDGVLRGSRWSGMWSTSPVGDLIAEGRLVPDAVGMVKLRACVTLSLGDPEYAMWDNYQVVE